ncbi:MAG: hypothetical protein ACLP0J_03395 [Solirubrobacteraceae bacterium]
MSTAPLRLVTAEPDWREALGSAICPEFRLDSYQPAADDPWLYGPHCAVAGCELPDPTPVDRRGDVRVCRAHGEQYRDRGGGDVELWLAGAGPLRAQRRRPLSYRLTIGGPLEVELPRCSAGTTVSTWSCSALADGPVCCCISSAPR